MGINTGNSKIKSTGRPFYGRLFLLAWLSATWLLTIVPDTSAAQTATPSTNATNANFPMGVDITGQLDQIAGPDGVAAVQAIAALNVSLVRFEFKATDPTNLKRYDLVVNRLQEQGLQILAVLIAPWKGCELDTHQNDVGVFVKWVEQVYLNGCGSDGAESVHQLGFNELTARYPSIQFWQIWNEPNVCGFLQSDLDDCGYGLWRRDVVGGERVNVRYGMQKFGALLATVYAERANKTVKIITGGILDAYNCSVEYDPTCTKPGLDNCYKLLPWDQYGCDAGTNLFINSDAVQNYQQAHNGQLPFDILGLHPYEPSAWANGYVPPALYVTQDIQRHVRKFVPSTYPIWITEWGFRLDGAIKDIRVCQFPVPSTTIAGCEANEANLLDSLVGGLNARTDLNISTAFWFNLSDGDTALEAGLIDPTGRKRPVWNHFQTDAAAAGQLSQQNYRQQYLQSQQVGSPSQPVPVGGNGTATVVAPTVVSVATPTPAPAPIKHDFMQQLYDLLNLTLK